MLGSMCKKRRVDMRNSILWSPPSLINRFWQTTLCFVDPPRTFVRWVHFVCFKTVKKEITLPGWEPHVKNLLIPSARNPFTFQILEFRSLWNWSINWSFQAIIEDRPSFLTHVIKKNYIGKILCHNKAWISGAKRPKTKKIIIIILLFHVFSFLIPKTDKLSHFCEHTESDDR